MQNLSNYLCQYQSDWDKLLVFIDLIMKTSCLIPSIFYTLTRKLHWVSAVTFYKSIRVCVEFKENLLLLFQQLVRIKFQIKIFNGYLWCHFTTVPRIFSKMYFSVMKLETSPQYYHKYKHAFHLKECYSRNIDHKHCKMQKTLVMILSNLDIDIQMTLIFKAGFGQ